jgi:hypothetical protein
VNAATLALGTAQTAQRVILDCLDMQSTITPFPPFPHGMPRSFPPRYKTSCREGDWFLRQLLVNCA